MGGGLKEAASHSPSTTSLVQAILIRSASTDTICAIVRFRPPSTFWFFQPDPLYFNNAFLTYHRATSCCLLERL